MAWFLASAAGQAVAGAAAGSAIKGAAGGAGAAAAGAGAAEGGGLLGSLGDMGKQIVMDRFNETRSGGLLEAFNSGKGKQQTLPGNGPEDTERITADVRPGETLTFTPPGELPPPNPAAGRPMMPTYGFKNGGQYVGGYQDGGQVENKSSWDRLDFGGKAAGVLLGILDTIGTKNPAALIRTPMAWGEQIAHAEDIARQEKFYDRELASLGPQPGTEGYDEKLHAGLDNPKRREELLYNKAHLETPMMQDYGRETRNLIGKKGLISQPQERHGGFGHPWVSFGDPAITSAGASLGGAGTSDKEPRTIPDWMKWEQQSRSIYDEFLALPDESMERIFTEYNAQGKNMNSGEKEPAVVSQLRRFMTEPRFIRIENGRGVVDPELQKQREYLHQLSRRFTGRTMGVGNVENELINDFTNQLNELKANAKEDRVSR